MRARMWVIALGVATVGTIGCQGAPTSQGKTGYLLVDREARDAGFIVEIGGRKPPLVLPVALTSDDDAALLGPTGRTALSGAEDELLWVRGPHGGIESLTIGGEVAEDELQVDGSEDAALALAEQLAAELESVGENSWAIRAADAFRMSATASSPDGLLGALPSKKERVEEQEGEEHAGLEGRDVGPDGRRRGPNPTGFSSELIDRALDGFGLPPAVSCTDPVAGTWVTQDYDERYGDWYLFTLHVRRNGAELVGDIEARSWVGTSTESAPAACDGRSHWTVAMSARGSLLEDGSMRFGGTSWRTDRLHCGEGPWGYNLDQFTGRLDGSHFSSVNNDGGRMIDHAAPFRRIACR